MCRYTRCRTRPRALDNWKTYPDSKSEDSQTTAGLSGDRHQTLNHQFTLTWYSQGAEMQDLASAIGNAPRPVTPNEYLLLHCSPTPQQGMGTPPAKLDL